MRKSLFLLTLLIFSWVFAQDSFDESELEAEINAVQGPVEIPPPELPKTPTMKPAQKSSSMVEEEIKAQNQVLKAKSWDKEVSADRNVDRFPKQEPLFVKPPGPKQGGSIRVEHPRAADGLIRINKDGSYQYRTKITEKSKSSSFKLGMMTPPQIKTENPAIDFDSMYGSDDIFAIDFDYVWQPFRKYGALGLKLGTGFATAQAKGFFKNQQGRPDPRSEETYNLFIVPLSAFLEYRFEYMRRQWVVPYVFGGGTYYGLAEVRDDGANPSFAAAPAAGGGGGLLLSISRLDSAGAFTLSEEYGIADMWLVLEARAMQGLSQDIDFTNQLFSAGITVDF